MRSMRLLSAAPEGLRGGGDSGSTRIPGLKVSEIFYSIQGEGILVGVPSVFVRLSGCQLRCAWCDTPYTSWNPEGKDLMLGEILGDVRRRWATHVVVTGGEPMIVEKIVDLTHALKGLDLHITVETAGTVYQPVVCDLMSISPKLANSTPPSSLPIPGLRCGNSTSTRSFDATGRNARCGAIVEAASLVTPPQQRSFFGQT